MITVTFPGRVFSGKRYALHGVYHESSVREVQEAVDKLRRQGWLARSAPAKRDSTGKRRVGYIGVYKRTK